MTTTSIRQKLHSFLETADDKKIKALYTLMEEEIETTSPEYNDDLKKEFEDRYAAYKNGTSIPVSAEESNRRIMKKMDATRK